MDATLQATQRATRGKNEARRLRAAGKIPGVVYGTQKEGESLGPLEISVDPKPLMRILHSGSGANTLITLQVEGASDARVLVKHFQLDPVTQQMLHADFFRVNMDRRITVVVPVVLKGEPRGVKLQGGVLDFLHREVEVECLPGDIPDSIDIDVSEMNVGDAVHLRDVSLNASWTPVRDADLMLVHLVTPRVTEEAPAAEAATATAEPEVAKKGKTEKEGEGKKEK